tara:strand:+ start:3036 stop:3317 length:282 start_codon:yes stop_codon:yes gene_type:complete
MSDFLKNSSDEEEITEEATTEIKPSTQSNEKKSKQTTNVNSMQEYVDIIDTSLYDAAGLNRYLLGKQNEGWKQRFPCVSHQRFLIFSWFKIEV